MIFEKYSQLAQVSGLTSLMANIIGFFFGFIVLAKAIRTNQRILYLFFLSIVFTISPWYPSGFGYLYWLMTGDPLPYQIYVTIGLVGVPIAILAWLDVYMTNINPDKKKPILVIYGIFSLIFEIGMLSSMKNSSTILAFKEFRNITLYLS